MDCADGAETVLLGFGDVVELAVFAVEDLRVGGGIGDPDDGDAGFGRGEDVGAVGDGGAGFVDGERLVLGGGGRGEEGEEEKDWEHG